MTKNAPGPKSKPLTRVENCRAVDIGISNFAECLLSGPNSCPYALPFGYCFLCHHPRLSEIIEHTQKTKPAAVIVK